jgi:hypothetical protein
LHSETVAGTVTVRHLEKLRSKKSKQPRLEDLAAISSPQAADGVHCVEPGVFSSGPFVLPDQHYSVLAAVKGCTL